MTRLPRWHQIAAVFYGLGQRQEAFLFLSAGSCRPGSVLGGCHWIAPLLLGFARIFTGRKHRESAGELLRELLYRRSHKVASAVEDHVVAIGFKRVEEPLVGVLKRRQAQMVRINFLIEKQIRTSYKRRRRFQSPLKQISLPSPPFGRVGTRSYSEGSWQSTSPPPLLDVLLLQTFLCEPVARPTSFRAEPMFGDCKSRTWIGSERPACVVGQHQQFFTRPMPASIDGQMNGTWMPLVILACRIASQTIQHNLALVSNCWAENRSLRVPWTPPNGYTRSQFSAGSFENRPKLGYRPAFPQRNCLRARRKVASFESSLQEVIIL